MTKSEALAPRPDALPRRMAFSSHQRAQFNAAIAAAGRQAGYALDVETTSTGETTSTLRKLAWS